MALVDGDTGSGLVGRGPGNAHVVGLNQVLHVAVFVTGGLIRLQGVVVVVDAVVDDAAHHVRQGELGIGLPADQQNDEHDHDRVRLEVFKQLQQRVTSLFSPRGRICK